MRPISISIGFGLFALCLVGLTGCSKTKTNAPPSGQAAVTPHHHSHGTARGLHGGYIIGLDIENYHAELTHDDKTKRVGVYVLGEDAATAAPIEAKSVTINARIDDKPVRIYVARSRPTGRPGGQIILF